MGANPLIDRPDLPHGAPPLDAVETEHFLPAIRHAIAAAERDIRAIAAAKEPATFENTVEALEFARARLAETVNVFTNLLAVKNSDALMEANR